jgi:type I restriction enzyme R subunit
VPAPRSARWAQPTTGTGRLIWHSLGAKTIELIHQNVHVDAVRDDLDKIILDAELLEAVLGTPDPNKKSKEIEIKISKRLRQHQGNPAYKKLSERLEALRIAMNRGSFTACNF